VTFNFDLLTPKSEAFTSLSKCIDAVSLVKMCLMLFKIGVNSVLGHTYICIDAHAGNLILNRVEA